MESRLDNKVSTQEECLCKTGNFWNRCPIHDVGIPDASKAGVEVLGQKLFRREDGTSGNGYICENCGRMWVDHIAPGSQCPASTDNAQAVLQKEPHWIPVTERLPAGEEVLYWDGERVSTFFPTTGVEPENQARARCDDFGITHWMPFPDAPSVGQRNDEQGALPVNPNSAPPPSVEHVKQTERDTRIVDWLELNAKRVYFRPHDQDCVTIDLVTGQGNEAWGKSLREAVEKAMVGNSPATSVEPPDTKRLDWLASRTWHGRVSTSPWGNGKAPHQIQDIYATGETNDLRVAIDIAIAEEESETSTESPVSSVERDGEDFGDKGSTQSK